MLHWQVYLNQEYVAKMVLLKYHQDIEDKLPEIIDTFTNIEDTQYETFNIRGIQKGV